MKTKSSKQVYESNNSLELVKVAIVALLVMVSIISAVKLASVVASVFV